MITLRDLRLSHWSHLHVVPYSVLQIPPARRRSCYDKPCGLWVSVDGKDDWDSWCRSESFAGATGTRYRVYLSMDANVLLLPTPLDVLMFREQYGEVESNSDGVPYIPWERVATDYQGIIIAPYHWSLRFKESWYYGWDCASGCIWDAGAIATVEVMREAA